MGTIERLEALERAATAGPWIAGDMGNGWPSIYVGFSEILGNLGQEWLQDGNGNATESVWETYDFIAEARNALPALLAVAKAAKAYHDMATSRYDSSRVAEFERKQDELGASLAQLEATP